MHQYQRISQIINTSKFHSNKKNYEDFYPFCFGRIRIGRSIPKEQSRSFLQHFRYQPDLHLQAITIISVLTGITRFYGLRRTCRRQGPVIWHHLSDHFHSDVSGISYFIFCNQSVQSSKWFLISNHWSFSETFEFDLSKSSQSVFSFSK